MGLNNQQTDLLTSLVASCLYQNEEYITLPSPLDSINVLKMIIDDEHYRKSLCSLNCLKVIDGVDVLRTILKHECPQNMNSCETPFANGSIQYMGSDGKVVVENQGLLGLSQMNDVNSEEEPVTREDVVRFIVKSIEEELQKLFMNNNHCSSSTIQYVNTFHHSPETQRYWNTVIHVLYSENLSNDAKLLTQVLNEYDKGQMELVTRELTDLLNCLLVKYEDDCLQVTIILKFALLWTNRQQIVNYVTQLGKCVHGLKLKPRTLEITHKNLLALLYQLFGNAHVKQKRFSEAVFAYSEAVRVNDKFTPAIVNRATSNIMIGKTREAIGDLSRVIDIDNKCLSAYLNRALVYKNSKRFREAISDLTKVIRLDSGHMLAYYYRSICYEEQGKYAQSLTDIKNALELDNCNPSFHEQLLKVESLSNQKDQQDNNKSTSVMIH